MKKAVADIIFTLRKDKGLTQSEVAKMLAISRQTYAGWEEGLYELSLTKLKSIADIYHISFTKLVQLIADQCEE